MQFLTVLLYILLAVTSLFLICLILIQRGKGGGLAGAFGGVGGSSAFGTKAGDVFTRVTMIAAGIWIAQCMLLVVITNRRSSAWDTAPGAVKKSAFTPSLPPETDGGVRLPDALAPNAPGGSTAPAAGSPTSTTPVPLPTAPAPSAATTPAPAAPPAPVATPPAATPR